MCNLGKGSDLDLEHVTDLGHNGLGQKQASICKAQSSKQLDATVVIGVLPISCGKDWTGVAKDHER